MGEITETVQSKSKGGRPKGARLSEMDRAVIDQIAREGFQTYSELRDGPLKACHRVAAWLRMKRLVRLGILHERKRDGGGILGWTISRDMISMLQQSDRQDWQGVRPGPSYKSSFQHDLVVRRVKRILSQSSGISDWKADHVLKSEAMSELQYISQRRKYDQLFLVPDGMFHLKCKMGEFDAALEVELTRKSRRRIYKKLEAYIISRNFEYAFFILGDSSLLELFKDMYQDVTETSNKVKREESPNGIYFTTLENIQRQGLKARFESESDWMSFANLA